MKINRVDLVWQRKVNMVVLVCGERPSMVKCMIFKSPVVLLPLPLQMLRFLYRYLRMKVPLLAILF